MKDNASRFLDELRLAIIEKWGEKIFTFVLYGSYASGTAKESSDIDIIIQLKPGYKKKELDGAHELLKSLCRKHGVSADWTLYPPFLKYIHPPIIIMEYDEMDWEKGSVRNFTLLSTIRVSSVVKSVFLENIKKSGRVFYGEDVLAKMRLDVSFFDRLVAFFAYPMFLWNKYSSKAFYKIFRVISRS
ncbi:MAG: hypothetical protein G01um101430_690 [Parcubacteria group bacterium Gr01-1014_30]|nr:MAG: hypothetical protein G01um101430_690 [Parcubacteria group bacterium Gr01-1014_30]